MSCLTIRGTSHLLRGQTRQNDPQRGHQPLSCRQRAHSSLASDPAHHLERCLPRRRGRCSSLRNTRPSKRLATSMAGCSTLVGRIHRLALRHRRTIRPLPIHLRSDRWLPARAGLDVLHPQHLRNKTAPPRQTNRPDADPTNRRETAPDAGSARANSGSACSPERPSTHQPWISDGACPQGQSEPENDALGNRVQKGIALSP